MANTLSVTSSVQAKEQFQGLFNEMWACVISVTDTDAVAIGDTAVITCTIPGVAVGDMVLVWGCTLDHSDGTDQAVIMWQVTAANTLSLTIMADAGEFAADAINTGVYRVLIGRPNW